LSEAIRADLTRQSRRICGYLNPARVYPSALATLVEEADQLIWIYPDGTREAVEVDAPLEAWAARVGCQLLDPAVTIYLGEGEYLYGIAQGELIVGTHEQICRNLSLRVAHWQGDPQVGAHLALFARRDVAALSDAAPPHQLSTGPDRAPVEEDDLDRFLRELLSPRRVRPTRTNPPRETSESINPPESADDQTQNLMAAAGLISERLVPYRELLRIVLQEDAPHDGQRFQLFGTSGHGTGRYHPSAAILTQRSDREALLLDTEAGRFLVRAMRDVAPSFRSLEASGARVDHLIPFLYWRLPRTGERSRAAVLRTLIHLAAVAQRGLGPIAGDAIIIAGARNGGIPV